MPLNSLGVVGFALDSLMVNFPGCGKARKKARQEPKGEHIPTFWNTNPFIQIRAFYIGE